MGEYDPHATTPGGSCSDPLACTVEALMTIPRLGQAQEQRQEVGMEMVEASVDCR